MTWLRLGGPGPPSRCAPPRWSDTPDASLSEMATAYDARGRCQEASSPSEMTSISDTSQGCPSRAVPRSHATILHNVTGPGWKSLIMLDLPSGTVTFLFTDIEGSAALWERDRQAAAAAVARPWFSCGRTSARRMASCSKSLVPPFTRASRCPPKQRLQPSVRRAGAWRQPVTRERTRDLCRSGRSPYRARHRNHFRCVAIR